MKHPIKMDKPKLGAREAQEAAIAKKVRAHALINFKGYSPADLNASLNALNAREQTLLERASKAKTGKGRQNPQIDGILEELGHIILTREELLQILPIEAKTYNQNTGGEIINGLIRARTQEARKE